MSITIKFKSDWVVQFSLEQSNNALSFVITSSKGEDFGHISVVQAHGDECIELYDYVQAKKYPEWADCQRYLLTEIEDFQEYLDNNIA